MSTGELVWKVTSSRPVDFPYISTFLAFRELPMLLDVLALASDEGRSSDVLMVDGSGVLHPRHCGLATMLGVIADIPTIGVTKKLLCGHYDSGRLRPGRSAPIELDGEEMGTAILPHAGTSKPLYVSPGHRIDVATATAVVCETMGTHRLPEPIYWADRVSRQESRRAAAQEG
jgi:deoxyribonuclease V